MSRSCHTIPCWACQLPTMRPWISVHYLGSHLLYFIYVSAYSCLTDCCTWLYFGAWVNFWCLFPLDRLMDLPPPSYISGLIPTWQIVMLGHILMTFSPLSYILVPIPAWQITAFGSAWAQFSFLFHLAALCTWHILLLIYLPEPFLSLGALTLSLDLLTMTTLSNKFTK